MSIQQWGWEFHDCTIILFASPDCADPQFPPLKLSVLLVTGTEVCYLAEMRHISDIYYC